MQFSRPWNGIGLAAKSENCTLTNRKNFESLSARQREVVARVAAGDLNKQIAAKLELSEVTVKLHRARAMHKMGAKTLAELMRMIEHCDN